MNLDKLDYYDSKGISIINLSFSDFFVNYQIWFSKTNKDYLKNLQKYTNPDSSTIKIDDNARFYLDKNLIQFKDDFKSSERIKKVDFYNGSEPNYQVIIERFDVIKENELIKLLQVFEQGFDSHTKTSIPKLVLINGDFGSGKTTFTLRAIKEYLSQNQLTLGFEIARGIGLKKGYLAQLIKESKANQFIFYCDNIETDSVFKRFNEIRVDLATEQYSDISIIFVSSIRENILEKLKQRGGRTIPNCLEFEYNATYNDSELIELVNNLKEVGLIEFRDREERNSIIYNLKKEYKGDSFITLYKLIEHGTHYRLLQKAYEELTPVIKEAFKIVALIHRFNMSCPVSVLKNALKKLDWEEFTENIVRGDGKKILFQENYKSTTNDPDLFFRTKHPIIADALIKTILRNNEKNALYKNIFSSFTQSEFNARFIVDLIKNLRFSDSDITDGQIDNYYEICKPEFEKSVHFMLSYITNVEKKTSQIKSLETCLNDIEVLESSLDYRNNRLIHRKGSINFKIAKLLYQVNGTQIEIKEYLNSAEEWFQIKKQMDPSSRYSYLDYFNLLMWKLKNADLDSDERLQTHININGLFDEAYRILDDDYNAVIDLQEEYNSMKDKLTPNEKFEEFMLDRYQNPESRPLACILMYYYYDRKKDYRKLADLLEELKKYGDNKEVVYFLFKYYGRNLHNGYNRIKFSELIRYNDFLKSLSPLRFYYFNSVCDAYDRRWNDSRDFLNELRNIRFPNLNPDFYLYWRDDNGSDEVFEGEIKIEKGIKKVHIYNLFKEFYFVKGNYKHFTAMQSIAVKLRFFFDGIRAEIV